MYYDIDKTHTRVKMTTTLAQVGRDNVLDLAVNVKEMQVPSWWWNRISSLGFYLHYNHVSLA